MYLYNYTIWIRLLNSNYFCSSNSLKPLSKSIVFNMEHLVKLPVIQSCIRSYHNTGQRGRCTVFNDASVSPLQARTRGDRLSVRVWSVEYVLCWLLAVCTVLCGNVMARCIVYCSVSPERPGLGTPLRCVENEPKLGRFSSKPCIRIMYMCVPVKLGNNLDGKYTILNPLYSPRCSDIALWLMGLRRFSQCILTFALCMS